MSRDQLTMFVSDFDKLSDARDNAAYRCVGAISAAICYCRQDKPKDALSILKSALAAYEHAEEKLERYKAEGQPQRQIAAA